MARRFSGLARDIRYFTAGHVEYGTRSERTTASRPIRLLKRKVYNVPNRLSFLRAQAKRKGRKGWRAMRVKR